MADDVARRRRCEVAGEDHDVGIGVAFEEVLAGVAGGFLVHAEDGAEVGHHALDRMVHDIARHHGLGAVGFHAHGVVPGCVTLRGLDPEGIVDGVVGLYRDGLTGLDDR